MNLIPAALLIGGLLVLAISSRPRTVRTMENPPVLPFPEPDPGDVYQAALMRYLWFTPSPSSRIH